MQIVIVTGMSGSGKSEAMNALEDLGFFCIDNLPPSLLQKFIEMSIHTGNTLDRMALGIDIRGYKYFNDLYKSLDYLKTNGYQYDIIFLEADDSTLIRRYKMTRRKHPLAREDNVYQGIQRERDILDILKQQANYVINTTDKSPKELKDEVIEIYSGDQDLPKMIISVTSFGFKHGIPLDADMVFDVRFMPNPYYVPELKEKTGDVEEVQEYVMNAPESKEFLEKLKDMTGFLIPQFMQEGKGNLMIAIGCTGGRHRSVTIANMLTDYLKESGYRVFKRHRDALLK